MAQLLVRNIDGEVKARLQQRAKRNGRSTEAEVREILISAVEDDHPPLGLGSRIAARFAGIRLTEDIEELRGQPARPAEFED